MALFYLFFYSSVSVSCIISTSVIHSLKVKMDTNTFTQTYTPVEEDAADVVVVDGGFLRAGSHPQRSEETVHQDVELVDVPVVTQKQTEQYSFYLMSGTQTGFRPVQ